MSDVMLQKLQDLTGSEDTALLSLCLSVAENSILQRLYPFDQSKTELPPRFENICVKIAQVVFDRTGTEGEIRHNENGVDITWASENLVPKEMLDPIVPHLGFIK